jgi:TetR/AcrR family fatty acid metabolism transcriptional regulator
MRVNDQVKTETRRALLDAGARAFAEHGYHRTNIDRVSESAGLAKGTVYNYFPSKRAIFIAALREACALASESADAIADSASTAELLEAFVAGNLAWASEHVALALLLARERIGGDREARELILEATTPCIQKLTTILQVGSERGELQLDARPREVALTFLVLTNALLLQALQDSPGSQTIHDLPATVTGLFLYGVAGSM